MWGRNVCLVAFMGLAVAIPTQAAEVPAELPLSAQLRELDREYSNGLEALLTKAKVQDDKTVVADIQARLAVVAKYRTVAPKREAKSLVIIATLQQIGSNGEFHISRAGVEWRGAIWYYKLIDATINGVPWQPGQDAYPLAVDSVLGFEARGQVVAAKVDRGPGRTAIRITRKVKADEPVTFRLTIKYLPPPTAAGSDGAKEPEAKKE
jgi:hypothetical protein